MIVLNNELWEKLIRMSTHVENHLAKALLRQHGLGLSEYRALQHLSTAKNSELRMQELAKLLCLDQSSVARLASRLEGRGFTIRDVCPNDKRGVYTILTNTGREHYNVVRLDYERLLTEAIEDADTIFDAMNMVNALRKL